MIVGYVRMAMVGLWIGSWNQQKGHYRKTGEKILIRSLINSSVLMLNSWISWLDKMLILGKPG